MFAWITNSRKSTPKKPSALRKFRNPLYTFVFIILRPFHELVSIRAPEKLLTRRCRRNASAECKSEFMMKNTKSFFRLLELPSLAHCCAGKCFLIEAYEWGRKKMLNIIHRSYACVDFLPHNPNRLMMKCCSARYKEPASLESFVSSTWRLSKWIRAFAAWKCVHEAATEEKNFCSLFSDFDFLLAFISVWRQKGPQSNRACMRIKQNFRHLSFVYWRKTSLLCDKRHSTACARRDERVRAGWNQDIIIFLRLTKCREEKSSIIDWFFGVLAKSGWIMCFDFSPAPAPRSSVSCWCFSTGFSSLVCIQELFVHKEISGFY